MYVCLSPENWTVIGVLCLMSEEQTSAGTFI